MIKKLLITFIAIILVGCGVSSSNEEAIHSVITKKFPNIESQLKASISKSPNFKDIHLGVWKWEYKHEHGYVYSATYQYYGVPPWWKTALGVVFGALGYNPWVREYIPSRPFYVDLDSQTLLIK